MGDSKELCQYLVEQDNGSMDIECEKLENDGYCASSVVMNVEGEPMDCSGDSNEISMAVSQLKALGSVKCFNIHEVS